MTDVNLLVYHHCVFSVMCLSRDVPSALSVKVGRRLLRPHLLSLFLRKLIVASTKSIALVRSPVRVDEDVETMDGFCHDVHRRDLLEYELDRSTVRKRSEKIAIIQTPPRHRGSRRYGA